MLTVLVNTISDSQVFAEKMQKLLTFFFSKNISLYAISNDQSFNNTLTNDIVIFKQPSPEILLFLVSGQNQKTSS